MTHLVFVYGSLKRGFWNHHLLADADFIGTGRTFNKYAMHFNGVPLVNKNRQVSQIQGELYQVDYNILKKLDRLERHPNWYIREQVAVIVDNADNNEVIYSAWIYFNSDKSGSLILSGNFEQQHCF